MYPCGVHPSKFQPEDNSQEWPHHEGGNAHAHHRKRHGDVIGPRVLFNCANHPQWSTYHDCYCNGEQAQTQGNREGFCDNFTHRATLSFEGPTHLALHQFTQVDEILLIEWFIEAENFVVLRDNIF